MYLQSTILMAVDLHISVTITVKWSEHDAEGTGPMAEEHEEAVSKGLLREDGPPLVHYTPQ